VGLPSNLHHFFFSLIDMSLLKKYELRWGSPTATPPFEPLNFATKEMFKGILLFLELNSQFGKLTDRTEGTPVPELVEGGYLLSALKSQRGEF
jgi:hypothetical protein